MSLCAACSASSCFTFTFPDPWAAVDTRKVVPLALTKGQGHHSHAKCCGADRLRTKQHKRSQDSPVVGKLCHVASPNPVLRIGFTKCSDEQSESVSFRQNWRRRVTVAPPTRIDKGAPRNNKKADSWLGAVVGHRTLGSSPPPPPGRRISLRRLSVNQRNYLGRASLVKLLSKCRLFSRRWTSLDLRETRERMSYSIRYQDASADSSTRSKLRPNIYVGRGSQRTTFGRSVTVSLFKIPSVFPPVESSSSTLYSQESGVEMSSENTHIGANLGRRALRCNPRRRSFVLRLTHFPHLFIRQSNFVHREREATCSRGKLTGLPRWCQHYRSAGDTSITGGLSLRESDFRAISIHISCDPRDNPVKSSETKRNGMNEVEFEWKWRDESIWFGWKSRDPKTSSEIEYQYRVKFSEMRGKKTAETLTTHGDDLAGSMQAGQK